MFASQAPPPDSSEKCRPSTISHHCNHAASLFRLEKKHNQRSLLFGRFPHFYTSNPIQSSSAGYLDDTFSTVSLNLLDAFGENLGEGHFA